MKKLLFIALILFGCKKDVELPHTANCNCGMPSKTSAFWGYQIYLRNDCTKNDTIIEVDSAFWHNYVTAPHYMCLDNIW